MVRKPLLPTGLVKSEIVARVPKKYAHKFTVVGDLMAEPGRWGLGAEGAGRELRSWGVN